MRSAIWLALGGTLASASDVAPHCGGPEVSIQSPGQHCGAHGSRWRGECRAPATCEYVKGPGEALGDICTASCAADADCAKLGAGFACSGTAGGDLERKVCVPRR